MSNIIITVYFRSNPLFSAKSLLGDSNHLIYFVWQTFDLFTAKGGLIARKS